MALRALPQDLDETYYRMLKSIPEEYKSSAIRLLQFLVYTKRPLTLAEAIEVIATEIDQEPRGFNINSRLSLEADILRYCPSLVIIAKVRNYTETVKELHLAHFSIKEYLIKQAQFDLKSASIIITRTYLTYLSDIEDNYSIIRSNFPMARYAAEYWTEYAVLAEASEDTVRNTIRFLRDETTFQRWCRLYQADNQMEDKPGPTRASRLYYACLSGLSLVTRDLISEGADVNAEGGIYGNPLQAASSRGYLEIMQLLLDNGADINAEGSIYHNALQAAIIHDHQEVIQLLLDNGADVNAEGVWFGWYGKALQAASLNGNPRVVQLLLDNGADINGEDYRYGNALQAALRSSDESNLEVVQLLLDRGANVNAQGGKYGSALHIALSRGDREIIKLLLDNGADVNAEDYRYGTALQAASIESGLEVVQLLLDKGADVNAQGGEYGSALQAASYSNNLDVVQLLLDKGADVNAEGGEHGNALQAALQAVSDESNLEVVQLLLEKGADVNAQGVKYDNALQAALSRGDLEIVQLLLDNGADVNAQTLQAVSHGGNPETVQLLNLNSAKMMSRKRSSSKEHQGANEITSVLDSTNLG
jgi:ankyrin repeat protein